MNTVCWKIKVMVIIKLTQSREKLFQETKHPAKEFHIRLEFDCEETTKTCKSQRKLQDLLF